MGFFLTIGLKSKTVLNRLSLLSKTLLCFLAENAPGSNPDLVKKQPRKYVLKGSRMPQASQHKSTGLTLDFPKQITTKSGFTRNTHSEKHLKFQRETTYGKLRHTRFIHGPGLKTADQSESMKSAWTANMFLPAFFSGLVSSWCPKISGLVSSWRHPGVILVIYMTFYCSSANENQ